MLTLRLFALECVFVLAMVQAVVSVGAQENNRAADELQTVAEKSDYKSTSLSKEVVQFVQACADRAEHVNRYDFGKTVAGRTMVSAIVASPAFDFEKPDGRAVVFLLGNIHAGECAGKEGLLMLLRELTLDAKHPLLKNLVIIFAPNYNADGNDKMAKNNRRGQKGPENGMGVRPNNMQLDLNREFIKLESPEARNLIAYFNKTDPLMFIDCHTTNGSVHQYGLTYDIPHNPATSSSIRNFMRNKMMPDVTKAVKKNHGYKTFYYGNFSRDRSSWTTYGYEPRYSTEYFGMRGGLGVLSEAYSYASYKDRIKVSRGFVIECLKFVSENKAEIQELLNSTRREFIKAAQNKPGSLPMSLKARVAPFDGEFTIEGFDGDQPKAYSVTFYGKYIPTKSRPLPYAYAFPARLTQVANHLLRHGAEVTTATADFELDAEVYTISEVQQSRRAFQKHRMLTVEADLAKAKHKISKGDFVVRTGQPLGRIVAYMLEPESSDGVVAWNFMDDDVKAGQPHLIVRLPAPVELDTEKVSKLFEEK